LQVYDDNTEASFLELELDTYTKYHSSLTSLEELFKDKTSMELKHTHIHASLVSELKKIDEDIYYDIVTELKNDDDEIDYNRHLTLEEIMTELVDIDFEKLKNRVTSAKRILGFIGQQLTILLSPNKNASSIYLTGHLPQDISKVQDEVPCEGKSVNNLDNVTSNVSNPIESYDSYDNMKITIEEYLDNIVDEINPNDFNILVDALYSYFTTGVFPKLDRQILFNPINKKRVGWALKLVYKFIKRGTLDIEYFRFAKDNINLFDKEVIVDTNFNKSKFYKLFHTNPAK
jgi:hypothetical protein